MNSRGMLRKFFPGANTCNGFHSFYDHIINIDAKRIFCIKGGPGVGKSTFMRAIGEQMLAKGYDVEFHCCSSDNNSVDGIVIPSLQIALLDGTAPHIVDPKNPGAVDEIIHLGDFWNEETIRDEENRKRILAANARVSKLFKIASYHLREAKNILDEWESYVIEATNYGKVNELTNNILTEIFTSAEPTFNQPGKIRRLFGSAISPEGSVNQFASILQGVETLYAIKGAPGTGKSTLISRILDKATMLGLDAEAYHCSLDPSKLDGVVIPSLKVAVINTTEPIDFIPSQVESIKYIHGSNLSIYIDTNIIAKYDNEVASAQERFWAAFNKGWGYITKAKGKHDKMEEFYIPHMDFEAINRKREEILARIFKYAEEA